jgi:hypothetical protein
VSTHKGSINDRLLPLEVGDYVYIETEWGFVQGIMSKVSNKTRKPKEMQGRAFVCELITCLRESRREMFPAVRIRRTA